MLTVSSYPSSGFQMKTAPNFNSMAWLFKPPEL